MDIGDILLGDEAENDFVGNIFGLLTRLLLAFNLDTDVLVEVKALGSADNVVLALHVRGVVGVPAIYEASV